MIRRVGLLGLCLSLWAAPVHARTVVDLVDLGTANRVSGSATWDAGSRHLRQNAATLGVDPGFDRDAALVVTSPSGECLGAIASGDLDGDSRDDLVVPCSTQPVNPSAPPGSGGARAYLSSGGGFTASTLLEPAVPQANGQCGAGIAVGDVNGDDLDDVAVACPGHSVNAVGEAGQVYLYLRDPSASGFQTAISLVDSQPRVSAKCGLASVDIGDVSGDGLGDVVVGCPGVGEVLVFRRSASNDGFAAHDRLTRSPPGVGDECGSDVATGDFDGDGLGEVAQACPKFDGVQPDAGQVVVHERGADGSWTQRSTTLTPNATNAQCMSIEAADYGNGGGRDLVVGCTNDKQTTIHAGRVHRLSGASGGGFSLDSVEDPPSIAHGDKCGAGVASLDLNADGIDDTLMGCPQDSLLGSGDAHLYVKGAGWGHTLVAPPLSLTSSPDAGACGASVVGGDFDADGQDDAVVACQAGASTRLFTIRPRSTGITFPATQTLVTGRLNRTDSPIIEASLDVSITSNGQRVDLELSNDGGASWKPASDAATVHFSSRGRDLRARFTFHSDTQATALVTAMRATYLIDDTPPTLSCESISGWAGVGTLRCTAADDGPVLDLDASWLGVGVPISSDGVIDLAKLSAGQGALVVRVTDRAGFTAAQERQFGVDRTAPQLVMDPRDARRRHAGRFLRGVQAKPLRLVDGQSGIVSVKATAGRIKVPFRDGMVLIDRMPNGPWLLKVEVADAAGNRATYARRILIDKVAPTVRNVSHFFEGFAYIQARDSTSGVVGPIKVRVKKGATRLRYRVLDRAGNGMMRTYKLSYHMSLSKPKGNRALPFRGWQYYTSATWINQALAYSSSGGYSTSAASKVLYREVQWRLTLLGYLRRGNTHGTFNQATIRAVQDYQRDKRLPPLGTVGPATRRALDNDMRKLIFEW